MDINIAIYNAVKKNCTEHEWVRKSWEDETNYYHVAKMRGEDFLEYDNDGVQNFEVYNVLVIDKDTLQMKERLSCCYACFTNLLKDGEIFIKRCVFRDVKNHIKSIVLDSQSKTEAYLESYAKGRKNIVSEGRYTTIKKVNGALYIVTLKKGSQIYNKLTSPLISNYEINVWIRTSDLEFALRDEEIYQFSNTYPELVDLYQGLRKDVTTVTDKEKKAVKKYMNKINKYDYELYFGKPLYEDEEIEIRPTHILSYNYYRFSSNRFEDTEEMIVVRNKNGEVLEKLDEDLNAYVSHFIDSYNDYKEFDKDSSYTKFTFEEKYVGFVKSDTKENITVFKKTKYGYLDCGLFGYDLKTDAVDKAKKYLEILSRLKG